MEIRRELRVCLIGMAHDAVEQEFDARLRRLPRVGELIFFERDTGRDIRYPEQATECGNYAMENWFFTAMTFLYTMLVVEIVAPRYGARYLGHGDSYTASAAAFIRDKRKGWELFAALTHEQRLLFLVAEDFFRWIETEASVYGGEYADASVKAYFGSEELASMFIQILRECGEQLVVTKYGVTLTERTMPALTTFVHAFKAFLFTNEAVLPRELREVVAWLREFEEAPRGGVIYGNEIVRAAVRMRDRINWEYIQTRVSNCPRVKRVVLCVGAGHLEALFELLQEPSNQLLVTDLHIIVPEYMLAVWPRFAMQLPEKREEIHRVVDAMTTELDEWRHGFSYRIGAQERHTLDLLWSRVCTSIAEKWVEQTTCLVCGKAARLREKVRTQNVFCDETCQAALRDVDAHFSLGLDTALRPTLSYQQSECPFSIICTVRMWILRLADNDRV